MTNKLHKHRAVSRVLAGISTLALVISLSACAGSSQPDIDEPVQEVQSGIVEPAAQPVAETSVSLGDLGLVAEAMETNHAYWTADREVESGQTQEVVDLDQATSPTLTITEAGTYLVKGSLEGQLVVDAGDDAQVTLILSGVKITSSQGPAVLLESADGVRIELAEGTSNELADAATSAEEVEENAALFSRVDLEISGTGSLLVTGVQEDGIASKDDLVISGGNIQVSAADDGVRGKDALVITGGTLDITSNGDGLKTTNEEDDDAGYYLQTGGDITVNAGDDGLDSAADALFVAGSLTIVQSVEGVEAVNLIVEGGDINVTSSDDGLNATSGVDTGNEFGDDGSNLVLAGGTVVLNAEGDGVDSNGKLTISGGQVTVFGTIAGGNGAFDSNGTFTLSGGEVLAVASGQMEQSPAEVGQPFAEAYLSGGAGESLQVLVGDETVLTAEVPKTFGYVFYSSGNLTDGEAVKFISGGGEATATATLQGGQGGFGGPGGGGPGGPGENPGLPGEPPAEGNMPPGGGPGAR